MFVPPQIGRRCGSPVLTIAALAMLMASAAAVAQTPIARPLVAPGVSESAREAYNDLDWTGRPLSPATLRKEAGAALVEGRRSCARNFNGAERNECLQLVQQDYLSMMARLKMRTAQR